MPRVLLAGFCTVPDANRAGVQIPHALRALAERYTVEVLTVREGDRAYVEHFRKTRMLRVPVPRGSLRERIETYQRALRRQVEGADYAAVHCCDPWSAAPALELRDRLGFKLVYDVSRRPALALEPALERERRRLEDGCLQAADLVLAPTAGAVRFLRAKTSSEVCLVPPGVDVDTFDWDVRPGGASAEVLYAGSIRAGVGIELLLRAMVDVCARTDAHLRLLGRVDPAFEARLAREIHAGGLTDRVTVDAPVENESLPREIARATLCVAPHAQELSRHPDALYPTKLLEYMACKRVALAPRRGTVTSLVTDGKDAVLFSPGDASELAAQILRLLGDPELAATIAEAGYRLVRDRHTASATRRALRAAFGLLEPSMPLFDTDPQLAAPVSDAGHVTLDITDSQLEADSDVTVGVVDHTDTVAAPTAITDVSELTITSIEPSRANDPDTWVVESGPLRDETHRHVRPTTEDVLSPAAQGEPATSVELTSDPDTSSGVMAQNRFVAGELETPSSLETPRGDDATLFTAVGSLLPRNPIDEADAVGQDDSGTNPG